MAQLDASLILGGRPAQIESPVNALAKVLQVQGAQQEGQMRAMQMQDAVTKREQSNKLAELYQSAMGADGKIDRNRLFQGAAQRGLGAQIPALQKQFAEADEQTGKVDAAKWKLASDRYGAMRQAMGALYQRQDLSKDLVLQTGQELVQAGIIPEEMYQKAIATMPDDPMQLRARLRDGLATQMKPEDILTAFAPKAEKIDNGQTISFRDTNPNSPTYGQNTGGAPIQKQQTLESIASNATTRRGQNMVDARGREANALKAREVEMLGQPGSGGAVLGAPVPAVLPWANQSNPKDANKVKAIEQSRGAKEIEKDLDAARKERDAAAQARRFIELNDKTATGGLVDRMGITRGLQSLGPEYAEMEAITAKLAPAMRVEGSGSTSDFDGKQFERATVGVDKPKAANKNIAQGVIARAQQAEEYADFRQTYLEQNGTLQGADRFWKDYANKNPIFDPEKAGTFELNSKRKPWKEHFQTQTVKGGPSPKASPNMGEGGVVDFGSLK